ncbi:MAG: hypothetical protein ABFQ95_04385 [Pseudomonadota bacterium]
MHCQRGVGYKLNSVFAYHSEEVPSKTSRFDFVYESEAHKGSTIHLLKVHQNSSAACTFPPKPDTTQKFIYDLKRIGSMDFYHAYRSKVYGPHEIVFQHGEYRYLLLIKPAKWTSTMWLLKILKGLTIEIFN